MHSLRQWGSLCAENKSTHEWRTEMSLLNFVLGLGLGKETAESRAGGDHGQVEVGTDADRAEAELGFSQDLEWFGMGGSPTPHYFSHPLYQVHLQCIFQSSPHPFPPSPSSTSLAPLRAKGLDPLAPGSLWTTQSSGRGSGWWGKHPANMFETDLCV